jgi:hypothetical protein
MIKDLNINFEVRTDDNFYIERYSKYKNRKKDKQIFI